MTNKDKIFKLVLSDPKLQESYNYNLSEYPSLESALNSDNSTVKAIAMIIDEINEHMMSNNTKLIEESKKRDLYKKYFSYLNSNLKIQP